MVRKKTCLNIIFIVIFFLIISQINCETIDFDIHTTALSAVANWNQNSFNATETINGEAAASGQANTSLPGVPDVYDGWAVAPYHTGYNKILWTFNSGSTAVEAIQLINVYNADEIIHTFSIEYTTDDNPTLNSTFLPVSNIYVINGNTGVAMNPVITDNKVDSSASPQRNYHVYFDAKMVTGIRLNTFPYSGTTNGNFVISEISFKSSAALGNVPEPNSYLLITIAILGMKCFTKKSIKRGSL